MAQNSYRLRTHKDPELVWQGAHRSLKTLNTLEFQKSVFKALENLEFFTSP